MTLARRLESCSFDAVWKSVDDLTKIVSEEVKGFGEALREFACTVVSDTYRKISEEDLLRILGYIDGMGKKEFPNFILYFLFFFVVEDAFRRSLERVVVRACVGTFSSCLESHSARAAT